METANAEIILDRTRPVDLSGYEKYNLFEPSTCTEPVAWQPSRNQQQANASAKQLTRGEVCGGRGGGGTGAGSVIN